MGARGEVRGKEDSVVLLLKNMVNILAFFISKNASKNMVNILAFLISKNSSQKLGEYFSFYHVREFLSKPW